MVPGGLLLTGCVDSSSTKSDAMAAAPLSSEVKSLAACARDLDSGMKRLGSTKAGGYKSKGASVTTRWNPQSEKSVNVGTRDRRADSIESVFTRQLPIRMASRLLALG